MAGYLWMMSQSSINRVNHSDIAGEIIEGWVGTGSQSSINRVNHSDGKALWSVKWWVVGVSILY